MNFIEEKEKLADTIEAVARGEESKENLFSLIEELKQEDSFKDKKLFTDTFNTLENHFEEFSRRELKQRALMIRSYIEE